MISSENKGLQTTMTIPCLTPCEVEFSVDLIQIGSLSRCPHLVNYYVCQGSSDVTVHLVVWSFHSDPLAAPIVYSRLLLLDRAPLMISLGIPMLGVDGNLLKWACRSLNYQISRKRLRRSGCHAGHSHRDPVILRSRGLAAPSLSLHQVNSVSAFLNCPLKVKAPNRRVRSRFPLTLVSFVEEASLSTWLLHATCGSRAPTQEIIHFSPNNLRLQTKHYRTE
jgi:hypothetical protein